MNSIDEAIEAVLQHHNWGTNERVDIAERAILLAVQSGHLIPADQLIQVGCVTEYLDGKHHCHYGQFSDGKRECRDTHERIDGVPVYRRQTA